MRFPLVILVAAIAVLALISLACSGEDAPGPAAEQTSPEVVEPLEDLQGSSNVTPTESPALAPTALPPLGPRPDEPASALRDDVSDTRGLAESGIDEVGTAAVDGDRGSGSQVTLSALTVTAEGVVRPIWPVFSSKVDSYTIPVPNAITRITIEGRLASAIPTVVAYHDADGAVYGRC